MHYSEILYRPPQEYATPLLEITQGCTHNTCRFCTMYRESPFRMTPLAIVEEDLQELAKQLGVDAEGTKKEIATRCAAVEVDIPDESELTEEDKRAAEEAAAEAAAKAEEEEAATELVKVKAQRRFLDKELNQIKDTGDEYAVSRERAAVLEEAGVAAVIEE